MSALRMILRNVWKSDFPAQMRNERRPASYNKAKMSSRRMPFQVWAQLNGHRQLSEIGKRYLKLASEKAAAKAADRKLIESVAVTTPESK